ncbi:MAG: hypothetical protein ACRD50_00855 [Candidatus Acidiferrales bacterium]
MKAPANKKMWIAILTAGMWLGLGPINAAAQDTNPSQQQTQQPSQSQPTDKDKPATNAGGISFDNANGTPEAVKADPAEEQAYQTFYSLKQDNPDPVIQQGEQFLQKYPQSRYAGTVYDRLAYAYFAKNQFDKMEASTGKAIALNKDDYSSLVLEGWYIPHTDISKRPDHDTVLSRLETNLKHAIELMPTVQKPATLSDDEFLKAKTELGYRAHSGLGLVYFREGNAAGSVEELQKATQLVPDADPADFYVLGLGDVDLSKFIEAADAFDKCAKQQGTLQDRCKSLEDEAKKKAAAKPAAKP